MWSSSQGFGLNFTIDYMKLNVFGGNIGILQNFLSKKWKLKIQLYINNCASKPPREVYI